jgi:hypothetical protein
VAEVRLKACTSPGFAYPYILFLLAVLKKKLKKPREALAAILSFSLRSVGMTLHCFAFVRITMEEMLKHHQTLPSLIRK